MTPGLSRFTFRDELRANPRAVLADPTKTTTALLTRRKRLEQSSGDQLNYQVELAGVAALARGHALDGVEARFLEGTLDLPDYFARKYRAPEALAAETRQIDLRIVALDTSFKLADPDESARGALLAFVPWAEALGVRWLRVFDGGNPCYPASCWLP